jgi:hypothetical protein
MIPGLVAKDNGGRITIEYMDFVKIDLSRIVECAFDKAFGPAFQRPENVVPIKKEKKDG